MKYPRLASMIFNTPLCVREDALDMAVAWANTAMHLNIINIGAAPGVLAMQEDDDGTDAPDQTRLDAARETGVYIIPVHGPLVSRSAHVEMCSKMTSYEGIRGHLNAALTDPAIAHIVLDVDSPGGSSSGMTDLAEEIFSARAIKPVTAIVNFSAYSAAYALASAASEIIMSNSSGVGSIGVLARHLDMSAKMEKEGAKVTTIYAGARKNDLSTTAPLSPEALAWLTNLVQSNYTEFTNLVARNRKMNPQAVRDTEAGVFHGQAAIAAGLADRIEAPQVAINRIARQIADKRRPVAVQSFTARAGLMNLQTRT